MGALGQRVDARIRPSGSMDAHGLGTDQLESGFEPILDPVAGGLALPSCERRAVVGNNQLKPRGHLTWLSRVGLFGFETASRLQPIEVPLQNHLRRHLVDNASRIARGLSAFA